MMSLSNNLRKSSTILSRRCFQVTSTVKRCLSSAEPPANFNSKQSTKDEDKNKDNATGSSTAKSQPKPSAPRNIPTRHSRHRKPLAAPLDTLEETKQKIIASTPGTLFCKFQFYQVQFDSRNFTTGYRMHTEE